MLACLHRIGCMHHDDSIGSSRPACKPALQSLADDHLASPMSKNFVCFLPPGTARTASMAATALVSAACGLLPGWFWVPCCFWAVHAAVPTWVASLRSCTLPPARPVCLQSPSGAGRPTDRPTRAESRRLLPPPAATLALPAGRLWPPCPSLRRAHSLVRRAVCVRPARTVGESREMPPEAAVLCMEAAHTRQHSGYKQETNYTALICRSSLFLPVCSAGRHRFPAEQLQRRYRPPRRRGACKCLQVACYAV